MTISVGGLSLFSSRNPVSEILAITVGKTDVSSIFCLFVFSIVSLVLAYLTNPSENSFRAYLTEQSFRQHLRHLDDATDDDQSDNSKSTGLPVSTKRLTPTSRMLTFEPPSPFHFANRASVSLRTPKHVFHSFGILTIAAMVPLTKVDHTADRDTLLVADSWYIGAFGRWWRGGIIEAWYQDVVARAKDEEGWSSGILHMKSLDMLHDQTALPFSTKNLPPQFLSRGTPPRLRNRERTPHKSAIALVRSRTPPPLPKSVSLPLHNSHVPSAQLVGQSSQSLNPLQPPPAISADGVNSVSALSKRSTSVIFDHIPIIVDVLAKISLSRSSVLELRTQLHDCQSGAAQSRDALKVELDSIRDRKRQEDAARNELKSRTKVLDDARRSAEGTRREAEKRLKAAQRVQERTNQRLGQLDREISDLEARLLVDQNFIHQSKDHISDAERELSEALESTKQGVRSTDDIVSTLTLRVRELENKLAHQKEKLEVVKRRGAEPCLPKSSAQSSIDASDVGPGLDPVEAGGPRFSITARHASYPPVQPLGAIPNMDNSFLATQVAFRANGYSIFGDNLVSLGYPPPSLVQLPSPEVNGCFRDSSAFQPQSNPSVSTIESDGLSRSFQSDSDIPLDKEWHAGLAAAEVQISDPRPPRVNSVNSSPISLHPPGVVDYNSDISEFGVWLATDDLQEHTSKDNLLDMQRASWLHRTTSEPNPQVPNATEAQSVAKFGPRRWFSTTSKDRSKVSKPLNPDAKVFNLSKQPTPRSNPGRASYDALNPNGLGTQVAAATTSSLLRAFAPSPAERQALQRALGGSTNTSFERLPTLSDVGTIPSSPPHKHAPATGESAREFNIKTLPSWIQSFPRIRKSNFSPWDDDESTLTGPDGGLKDNGLTPRFL